MQGSVYRTSAPISRCTKHIDTWYTKVPSYTECTGPLLDCRYDVTQIPDVYDSCKYDLLHNAHLNLEGLAELFKVAQVTYMFFCIKYLIT
ncbi:hypothetical protein BHM03_00003836 [Ensete ventricosum]|nr:hypothetical protein BHM03_00003836 [Ensete ventricosum]